MPRPDVDRDRKDAADRRDSAIGSSGSSLVIGIDVGGTKIAGGLLDAETGRAMAKRVVPTDPQRGGVAVLGDVVALAAALAAEAVVAGRPVAAVGLGVAELVDPMGRITSAHTFDWRDLPIRERLGAVAPATIVADVRAAALAEARIGAGQGVASFAYVTIGTGISSALVLDGVPLAGARGNALVLSSGSLTTFSPAGEAQPPFVVEEFASGPAIARRYAAQTGGAVGGAEAVVAEVGAGDPIAAEVVATAAEAAGSAIGFLLNITDPEALVVGGGLGSAPGAYWDALVAAIRGHVWSPATRVLPIVQARLGNDAGWIGAAFAGADVTRRPQGAPDPDPAAEPEPEPEPEPDSVRDRGAGIVIGPVDRSG